MKWTNLPGREVLGEQPPPLSSLGYPFIRQGDVSPVRSDLTVPYPMDPHVDNRATPLTLLGFDQGERAGRGAFYPRELVEGSEEPNPRR